MIFEHDADYHTLSKNIEFNTQNIHIVEGAGVDCLRFNYHPEPDDNNLLILFASRLLWSKGLDILVEPVDKLRQQNIKNVTLNVAGIVDDSDPDGIKMAQINEWVKQEKQRLLLRCRK